MKKALFIIPFLLFTSISIACDCKSKLKRKDAIKSFDVVFTGKIISKKITDINDSLYSHLKFSSVAYKVLLIERIKGEIITDTLTIYTGSGGPDCGVSFEIGKNYIIYSRQVNKDFHTDTEIPKYLTTNSCTRTSEFDEREYKRVKRYARRKGYC